MGQSVNLVAGSIYNSLTVLRLADISPTGRRAWVCRCICGAEKLVEASKLTSGHIASCGCEGKIRRTRAARAVLITHGASGTLQYVAWQLMHDRCSNPNNENYHRYGARGIKVCERWRSYELFLADMGPRPPGLTLDRMDNDGGYRPDNCRWATRQQQSRNQSCNRRITAHGETRVLVEWAELSGIPRERIANRLKRGWIPERAIPLRREQHNGP